MTVIRLMDVRSLVLTKLSLFQEWEIMRQTMRECLRNEPTAIADDKSLKDISAQTGRSRRQLQLNCPSCNVDALYRRAPLQSMEPSLSCPHPTHPFTAL